MLPMSSRGSRLSCTTKEGFEIRYQLIGLGTPSIKATARVVNKSGEQISSYDISKDIRCRQVGTAKPFRWTENFFDIFVGNYLRNPSHRNWAGSDLGGGTQIHPGGIGDVLVPATDPLDAISKKHDIEFWLSANFEPHTEVQVKTDTGVELFEVKRRNVINRKAVLEYLKALFRSSRL
jgi:hypothetical protein